MSITKSELGFSKGFIARSAGVIGLATFCSRILGLIRDIIIARLFGVYALSEAFVIAFRIPNLFRDILGEGAASAAFVPVFSEYLSAGKKEEFWALCRKVMVALLAVLAAITLLGIIFAPFIVRVIAPGFTQDPEKLALTIRLTRIIFPYVLLICLAAYAASVLNSLKHFAAPAFAPCLLNLSIIICALVFGEGVTGLAAGVLIGGLAQLAIQLPALYSHGFAQCFSGKEKSSFSLFKDEQIRKIGKLLLPRIASTSIYQCNAFVDTIFGSLSFIVGQGGVAALYFSYRLVQFPLGIFSNSLAQAILPEFSCQAAENRIDNVKETLSFGLRMVFLMMIPAAFGFIVLGKLITDVLFRGGRFDAYSANLTSGALLFFSIGIPAFGAGKILSSCFFALKDTATPAKNSLFALLLNIAFNCLLIFPMGLRGIALSTSLSGIISGCMLYARLKKKVGGLDDKHILLSVARITLASLGMAAACKVCLSFWGTRCQGFMQQLLLLLGLILLGLVTFLIFCRIFSVNEIRQAPRIFNRRFISKCNN